MKAILLGLISLFISFPMFAQKSKEFRTGHLVKKEQLFVAIETGQTASKASYLIRLRDGSVETVGLYHVTVFGHDYVKPLKEDADVFYRISGKHLFVKSQDGHEIKALLCEVKGNTTFCGSDAFSNVN